MRWLQWSFYDGAKGVGGVEVHMRCLARELEKRGVEVAISSDPNDLRNDWDVIQTHGAGIHIFKELRVRLTTKRPLWVHTLHGYTHQRIVACREFTWLGGYQGIARELVGSLVADAVFTIHPGLDVRALKLLGKTTAVCGNGWDSDGDQDSADSRVEIPGRLDGPFWVFIGRDADPVKGVPRLLEAVKKIPHLRLVAVPGEGMNRSERVISLGFLNPHQIRLLLRKSQGLLLTSYHEGLPLVVLEALAEGVPVVSTNVGGIKTLSEDLEGFVRVPNASVKNMKAAIGRAEKFSIASEARLQRAKHNRLLLRSWRDVATTVFETVKPLL